MYTIHDLGTLPGGTASSATAINDNRHVVGESTNAAGVARAFLWQAGVMTDLGDLGGGMSTATAINGKGQVVGESTNVSGAHHAFLWQAGIMTDLGTLPGGYRSRATDINDKGQVVGWSATRSVSVYDPDPTRPFLWQGGVMTDLGRPDATASWPVHRAVAINEKGQIVVRSDGGPSGRGIDIRTFVWHAGAWTNVSDPYGPPRVIGADINAEGQVAGWSGGYSRYTSAWVWDHGVLTGLGTLGGYQPEAHAINGARQVVGYDQAQGGAMGVGHGFLWDNGTMKDLGALFDGGLSTASGLNGGGDVVGWGYAARYGPAHAVLWRRSG